MKAHRKRLILSVMLTGFGAWGTMAVACRYATDPRPLVQRLDGAALVFVGTVVSDDRDDVVFSIEKVVKGQPGTPFRLTKGRSSCDIRFRRGERWLYAGPTVANPSVLLQDENGRAVYRENPQQASAVDQVLAIHHINLAPSDKK